MSDDAEQLGQEDVEDEGQAVVDRVQVGAEPVQDSSERGDVKEFNLAKKEATYEVHLRNLPNLTGWFLVRLFLQGTRD